MQTLHLYIPSSVVLEMLRFLNIREICKMILLCSVKATIDRYKKASSDSSSNGGSVSEANSQVKTLPFHFC